MNDINELIVVNKSLEQQNFITEFVTFLEEFLGNPEDTKDEIIDSKISELDGLVDKGVPLFRMEIDKFRQNITTYLSDFHQRIQFAFRAQAKKEMLIELKGIERDFKRFNDDRYILANIVLGGVTESDINSIQDIFLIRSLAMVFLSQEK